MSNGEKSIRIEAKQEEMGGKYTNLALIHHMENEFVFDFLFLQPQIPAASFQARVITNPVHAKEFLKALTTNIKNYEKKFGRVKKRKKKLPKIEHAELKDLQSIPKVKRFNIENT